MSILKINKAGPSPRDGHSVTAYEDYLIVFGGCEGSDDESPPFNEVCLFDVRKKQWNYPTITGQKPHARDGHAAGLLSHFLLVYGGCAMKTIFEDTHVLNLKTFEWRTVEQIGDLPGPRESMGSAVAGNKMYIFGGNINNSLKDEDEYTNDLFEITLSDQVACFKHIEAKGPSPPKRHSLSLSNMKNKYLIVFGGESYGQTLNDI